MRQNKIASTRDQPFLLYAIGAVFFVLSAVIGIAVEYEQPWLDQLFALLPRPQFVHWYSRQDAEAECKKTRKPILYFFLPQNNAAAAMLAAQCLGDKEIASLVNRDFIPVLYAPNLKRTSYSDSERKYFRQVIGLDSDSNQGPIVSVVPYCLQGTSSVDKSSSSNLSELGVASRTDLSDDTTFRPNRFVMPRYFSNMDGPGPAMANAQTFRGYGNKEDFVNFLLEARLWHKLPPSQGLVHWLPLSSLDLNVKSKKPVLLAFVGKVGYSSDLMRLNLFWKTKSVETINKRFEPYLVEFDLQDPSVNAKFLPLREKYNIRRLPALIVIDDTKGANGPGVVAHGFDNFGPSLEFLQWAPAVDKVPSTSRAHTYTFDNTPLPTNGE